MIVTSGQAAKFRHHENCYVFFHNYGRLIMTVITSKNVNIDVIEISFYRINYSPST